MPTSYPHILLTGDLQIYPFKPVISGGNNTKSPLDPDRQAHSSHLENKLRQAWQETESRYLAYHATRSGVYLEFRENPGFELATQSLENMQSKKIRLLNVRKEIVALADHQQGIPEQTATFATVYVDNEKRDYFLKKIEEYATRDESCPQKQKAYQQHFRYQASAEHKTFLAGYPRPHPGRHAGMV